DFVAIGLLGSQFIWFPAGVAKAYPAQHTLNVILVGLSYQKRRNYNTTNTNGVNNFWHGSNRRSRNLDRFKNISRAKKLWNVCDYISCSSKHNWRQGCSPYASFHD